MADSLKPAVLSLLRTEGVKLWLAPYTAGTSADASAATAALSALGSRYATVIAAQTAASVATPTSKTTTTTTTTTTPSHSTSNSVDAICDILEGLRLHALDKLAKRAAAPDDLTVVIRLSSSASSTSSSSTTTTTTTTSDAAPKAPLLPSSVTIAAKSSASVQWLVESIVTAARNSQPATSAYAVKLIAAGRIVSATPSASASSSSSSSSASSMVELPREHADMTLATLFKLPPQPSPPTTPTPSHSSSSSSAPALASSTPISPAAASSTTPTVVMTTVRAMAVLTPVAPDAAVDHMESPASHSQREDEHRRLAAFRDAATALTSRSGRVRPRPSKLTGMRNATAFGAAAAAAHHEANDDQDDDNEHADEDEDDNHIMDEQELTITNQAGQIIQLPTTEKRALMLAMALHEKGKAIMHEATTLPFTWTPPSSRLSSPRASQPSSPASSVPSSPSAGLYTTAPPLFPPTFLPSSPLPQSASATPSTTTTTTTTTTTSTNQGLTAAAAALAPLASPQRALPQPVEIERQRLYSSALTFLLEADAEFAKCRSDILDNVDNLGLLQLDIVYCYLMLRDVTSLPDATRRLATCEATLKRSYGANLERLRRTREGAVPPEMVFLVRLKLLKAAVLFHETAARRPAASGSNPTAVASAVVSARAECSRLLEEVTREITSMKPDPAAVEQLMTMGLTSTQARVALRGAANDVSRALELHFAHRQQEQTHREQHEQSRFNRELQRRLGRTTRGEWVDVNLFQYLHSTGFPKHAAGAALRQANNNLEIAMQLLTTCPQLFAKPTHHRRRTSAAGSSGSAPPSPAARMGTGNLGDLTALLSSMGIYMPAERIQQTLAECDGDLNRAFERLQKEQFGVEDAPATPGSGASATPVDSDDDDDDDGFMDDTEHTRQVIANEILPTISKDSLAYLDMNLDEEESVAHFYQSLLAKLQ